MHLTFKVIQLQALPKLIPLWGMYYLVLLEFKEWLWNDYQEFILGKTKKKQSLEHKKGVGRFQRNIQTSYSAFKHCLEERSNVLSSIQKSRSNVQMLGPLLHIFKHVLCVVKAIFVKLIYNCFPKWYPRFLA